LLAILLLYDGKNIHEVAEIIRRSERTIKAEKMEQKRL